MWPVPVVILRLLFVISATRPVFAQDETVPKSADAEPRCAGRGRALVLFVALGFAVWRRAAVLVPVAVFLAGRAGRG